MLPHTRTDLYAYSQEQSDGLCSPSVHLQAGTDITIRSSSITAHLGRPWVQ